MNLYKYAITALLVLGGMFPVFCAGDSLASFLGKSAFEKQRLFDDQRYPNVVVTTRGTVMTVWGNDGVDDWGLLFLAVGFWLGCGALAWHFVFMLFRK